MRQFAVAIPLGLALVATGTTGCDRVVEDDDTTDGEAPLLVVTSPERGAILGDVEQIVVTGTVTDPEDDLAEVTVNGIRADVGIDGAFTVAIPAHPGTTLVKVVAIDGSDNAATDTRSVLAGVLSSTDMLIPDAVSAGISNQAFNAIGDAAAGFIASRDLATLFDPTEPVFAYGWSGPGDCLFVRGWITSLTVGGAAIDLESASGGLALATDLGEVYVEMHLEYAVACIDGSREVTATATHVGVDSDVDVSIANGGFDVSLADPDVALDGLDVDLGGIPGAIADLLQMDTILEWVLPWAVEQFVAPMVTDALGSLGDSHVVTVLGEQIEFQMVPVQLDFTPAGAKVRLDGTAHVIGDQGPGFVYLRNTTPNLSTSDGFRIALADDLPNQLFASFWGAGGMDYTLPLSSGEYGDVGVLFDSVRIEALLPPSVRADGDGELAIVVGDLMAEFSRDGKVVTQIAINGTLGLSVIADGDTRMKLQVGEPEVDVDILAEGVDGANSLDHEAFEALVSFAATRATHAVEGPLGSIPLPAVGGVMLSDVDVAATNGFIQLDGRLVQ
jgi:hypothetical protein